MITPIAGCNQNRLDQRAHRRGGIKLRVSGSDLKAVQGDGGWSTPDMATKRCAHILDEDRRMLASEMEQQFYQRGGTTMQTAGFISKSAKVNEPEKEKKAENPDKSRLSA